MSRVMREIVLDGPGKNALSTKVMRAALLGIASAPEEPLLVSGRGDAFSAGLNLKEIATLDDEGLASFLVLLDDLVVALYNHAAPVVAHVNGHAIAGGCIIAMCADVRVATSEPSVRIGLNEVALGLEFPPRILKLARARIAPHAIDRVLLEGGLHAPLDALRMGLVDEIADDSAAVARSICEKLATHPHETYRATKRSLRAHVLDLHELEMAHFRDVMLPRWCTRRGFLAEILAR